MRDQGLVLFYCYSHADEGHRNELETHLTILRRKGFIREWSDRKIPPGAEWKKEIDQTLDSADIILLLVSADFLASDYCYDVEMQHALERHQKGEALVIPVIVRPVDFEDSPFAGLQALPTDAKPVTTWDNRDEAWLNVARGVRIACANARELKSPPAVEKPSTGEGPFLESQEEDFGILDFSAELEVAMQVATDCQIAIARYADEVTEALKSATEQAQQLSSSTAPGRASRLRHIAASMAAALAAYAKKTENTASELAAAWDRVDRFFPKLMNVSDIEQEGEQIPELKATLRDAVKAISGARESAMTARESLTQIAKLSAALKLGAHRAQNGLQAIIDQYWRMENSIQQMLSIIAERFGEAS